MAENSIFHCDFCKFQIHLETTVRSIRVSDWWRQKSNNFFGENLPFAFLYYTHLLLATWLSL